MKELQFNKEVYVKALEQYETLTQMIGGLQNCSTVELCEKFNGYHYEGDGEQDYFDFNYGLLTVTLFEDLATGKKRLGDTIDIWGDNEIADYDQLSYEELKSVVNNYKG